MLLDGIRVVQEGGDPMGLIRDPEMNDIIELPGWFALEGDREASIRDLSSADGLLDERREVVDVPLGAARQVRVHS